MDKGVDFVITEMPNASPFQIHIHSAMAEESKTNQSKNLTCSKENKNEVQNSV